MALRPETIATPHDRGLGPASPWPRRLLEAGALVAVLACVALAWLWLARQPYLTAFDEVGHINNSLSDALFLRQHQYAELRDTLFVQNRWLPPGLRLVGLPIAALFWAEAPIALRIAGGVMFLATAVVLWLALRPLGGRAGAAAGVALFALSPVNLFGAQNFMTEAVLHLCAAIALWMVALEAAAARASVLRLAVLGLAMGLGMLTKQTFLPCIAPAWLGVVAFRWWQGRDRAELILGLLLPPLMTVLLAWPHYALNGVRYAGYAAATAQGFAFTVWPETGLAFVARALRVLWGGITGPGGGLLLLVAVVLAPFAWRRAGPVARLMAGLGLLAGLPTLAAFLLSHNQSDRYLGMTVLAWSFPVAVAVGLALRQAGWRRWVSGLAGLAGVAALLQSGLAVGLALTGPAPGWLMAGLNQATWRPNYACELDSVAAAVPMERNPATVGVFGSTDRTNAVTVRHAFLRAGRRAATVDLGLYQDPIDWPAVLAEAARQDLIVG